MAKKYRIQQKVASGIETLHPETDSAVVKYTPAAQGNLAQTTGDVNVETTVKEALDQVNALAIVHSVNGATGAVNLKPSDIGAATSAQGTLADNAMPKAGGTFTGAVTLASDPTANLHAATKQYVDQVAAAINSFEYEVAASLPTASASTMRKIYLVASTNGSQDAYDEFITVKSGNNYSWEKIGNTDVDLSQYAGKVGDLTASKVIIGYGSGAVTASEYGIHNTFSSDDHTNLSTDGAIAAWVTGTAKAKSAGSADTATNATNATNATTATKANQLTNSKNIKLTGDVTGSASFNGTADANITATLANSGVTAGTYSAVSVNAKGLVTAGAQFIEIGTTANGIPSSALATGGLYFQLIED